MFLKNSNNPLSKMYFWVALFLAVIGKAMIWGVAIDNDLWSNSSLAKNNYEYTQCKIQDKNRNNLLIDLNNKKKISQTRLDIFNSALIDDKSEFFLNARDLIRKENKVLTKIKTSIKKYPFQSLKSLIHYELFYLLLSCFGLFYIVKLIKKDAYKSNIRITKNKSYNKVYAIFVCVFCSLTYARYSYTSYFLEKKEWFTWESFCISPEIFYLSFFPILGMAMLQTYPIVLWVAYSNKDYIPKINFKSNHGFCGARSYIQFIEKWMIIGFTAIVLNSILWIKKAMSGGGYGINYGILTIISVIFISVLLLRGLRNLMIIRENYLIKIYELDNNSKELKVKLEDPTSELLGKYWWKLAFISVSLIGFITAIYNNFSIIEWISKN